jgi:hypothetical protein
MTSHRTRRSYPVVPRDTILAGVEREESPKGVGMKAVIAVLAVVVVLGCGAVAHAQDAKKFGDAVFLKYEGTQSWPTGDRAQSISDYAVPIYLGLPSKRYKVVGRIYDERTSGMGVVGRAFAEGLFSEKDRQRDCADQAKYRGGDALIVTSDERIIGALGLSKDEVSKTAPLFQHKDSVVLVVKFD